MDTWPDEPNRSQFNQPSNHQTRPEFVQFESAMPQMRQGDFDFSNDDSYDDDLPDEI